MSDETKADHLKEARHAAENAAVELDRGNQPRAAQFVALGGLHAQIAVAERFERVGDLLDGTTDELGLIGVTGHVTSGSP
jgi:hypothetical protein